MGHRQERIERPNPPAFLYLLTAAILFAASGAASAQSVASRPAAPATAASTTAASASTASEPIPNIAILMSEVLVNQNQIDKIKEKYSCLDAREADMLDKHGNVKKKMTYVYQVSFLDGEQVQRLIAIDGNPLSSAGQKKEDSRVGKQIRKIEKEHADEESGKKKNQTTVTMQDFLRADRFFHPRRVGAGGRNLIVFDFDRNPNFKPKTLMEKIVQALAGTIWIDAQAHEVARLEAHVASNLRIYGPLLSVHKGSAVVIEQAFVDNQVWLPTYVKVHIDGRLLLFHGFKVSQSDRFSDYKVFHVQTRSTISSPTRPL